MFDLRPVGYVIGLLVVTLGAAMLVPLAVDVWAGNGHWPVFAQSAIVTALAGGLIALACANGAGAGLSLQQTFLLTTGVWLVLPAFGALPFVFGVTEARAVDAMFEAMSGLTTTGSTVLSGLDTLPAGLLMWRGLLQWLGGIGIIVVAMVFLPELRVGGMQIFRAEAFDTMGKILPRAAEIATRISSIYVGLTGLCALAYLGAGMTPFDAVVHSMTTIATGGFANSDASFSAFGPAVQYWAALFMLLAALPFVRFVQFTAGTARPLLRDSQVHGFLGVAGVVVLLLTAAQVVREGALAEETVRGALFNAVSILTGTGYASADYMQWGAFAALVLFFAGLIGGCAGSTSCSIKIFRYQLLLASIRARLARINAPHGVFEPRYQGRPVSEEVMNSVIAFFVFFVVTLGVLSVALSMTGLDFVTSVSGAATALANVGPGLGAEIGPTETFAGLNDAAKWMLVFAMLLGRLELLAVYAIFTVTFWRA